MERLVVMLWLLVVITIVQSMSLFKAAPSDLQQLEKKSQIYNIQYADRNDDNAFREYQQSNDYIDEEEDDPEEDDEELGITDEEYIEEAIPETELNYANGDSLAERPAVLDSAVQETERDKSTKRKDETLNILQSVEDNTQYLGERESNSEEGDGELSFGKFRFQPKQDATVLKINKDSEVNRVAWDELKAKEDSNSNNVFDEEEDSHRLPVYDEVKNINNGRLDDGLVEYDEDEDFE